MHFFIGESKCKQHTSRPLYLHLLSYCIYFLLHLLTYCSHYFEKKYGGGTKVRNERKGLTIARFHSNSRREEEG